MRFQQGIALIQVLLMVAVISIMLIIMMTYTKLHLQQISDVQDHLEQRFELYSAATEVQYSLLTEDWLEAGEPGFTAEGNPWARGWNLYGDVFTVGNYEVRIQNMGSLVSTRDELSMRRLLIAQGYSEHRAYELAATARRWQRVIAESDYGQLPSEQFVASRIPIQHIRELEQLPGWDKEVVDRIAPYLTVVSAGLLNPAYLPEELLLLAVSPSQSDILAQIRREGQFNRDVFSRLSGIEVNEFMSFFPGPAFRVELSGADSAQGITLRLDAIYSPYTRVPYSLRRVTHYY